MPTYPGQGSLLQRFSRNSNRSLAASSTILPLTTSAKPSTIPTTSKHCNHIHDHDHIGIGNNSKMSSHAPISPGAQKGVRRSSVLGASRKIGASIKRPMRAVGRKLGRSGHSSSSSKHRKGDEEDPEEEEEEDAMVGYGALVCADDDDGDSSQHSSELVPVATSRTIARSPSVPSSRRRASSSRSSPLVIVGGQGGAADPDWPVHYTERIIRHVLLICAAYIIGAKRPEFAMQVSRATEYAVTAWSTCVVILVLTYIQKYYPHLVGQTARQREVSQPQEQMPLLPNSAPASKRRSTPRLIKQVVKEEEDTDYELPIERSTSLDDSIDAGAENPLSHPSLSCLYVVDVNSGQRIYPNAASPTHLSNEWFDMQVMIIIRTPDVDDPSVPSGTPSNNRMVEYLTGKQRHFEFQYQIRLKKVPTNKQVYFACELEEPIRMGIIQRAFVGAAMAFMKSTNPTFHYSITGSKEKDKSSEDPDRYEKPHMSFTVEGSLDRLVVTKPGETVPQLGTVIHEDAESIKRRKKGVAVDWNTDDTYTMALWSAYVDFIDWRVLNLPGIRPFGLNSVLGAQAMNLTMYLIDENRGNDKHYRKDITNVINWELSNDKQAECGPAAGTWTKENQRSLKKRRNRAVSPSDDRTDINGDISESQHEIKLNKSGEDFGSPDDLEDLDEDAETAAELGEGIYMRSGDSVCLRDFPMEGDEHNSTCSVANGGGFAVLQEQDVYVVIEKARRSKRNRLIKSGDAVIFKIIQKKGEEVETRYLTIHRGWWLKWVSSVPSKNGYFTIYTHETEFGDKDGKPSGETQSSYLTMGGSFTLRHKRWSSYHVGVAAEPSPTYGGRMLGLYNPKSKNGGHSSDEQYHSDEGEGPDTEGDPEVDNKKLGWMKPLVLCAIEPSSLLLTNPATPKSSVNNLSATEFEESPVDSPTFITSNTLVFSGEHSHVDVPAWIEMMNRTERVRQLTYVVRVLHRTPAKEGGKSDDEREDSATTEKEAKSSPKTFVRLRSGRELAQIMRIGQSVRAYTSTPTSRKSERRNTSSKEQLSHHSRSSNVLRHSFADGTTTPPSKRDGILSLSPRLREPTSAEIPMDFSFDNLAEDSEEESIESVEEEEGRYESDDQGGVPSMPEQEEEIIESESELETDEEEPGEHKKRGAVQKGKSIMGKVAKTAKSATVATGKLTKKTVVGTGKLTKKTVVGTGKLTAKTVVGTGKLTAKAVVGTGKLTGKAAIGTTKVAVGTGKAAVRQSKKVAKGTVNVGKSISVKAGKAVIAPISRKSKKPPKAEPKGKRKEKDLHVLVSKSMKKLEKKENKAARPPTFMAGELCAAEQSCRTASRVLSRMSSVPFMSPAWKKFNEVLTSGVARETDQDRWFLEGNAVQLGVTPLSGAKSRGVLLHESLVARCLWESHWREEWCGMFETCVSLYAPSTKSPCLEIAFIDITNIRPLDAGELSPLPGYPLLVLETAWLCHYIAFRDEESRDTFGEKAEEALLAHIKQVEASASILEVDLRKARFWQGFQSLSESSLTSGTGKWAKVSSKDTVKERTILNGRRMAFDNQGTNPIDMSNGFVFVEDLLSKALSFSLESLEKDPESFIEFVDLTSQLRLLPLDEIDLTSRHAFCLFANIYHCLLQQAMLLSVNGPLLKKSVAHFMRTSCYEIGGDVFSLAELYCCVLRGKMAKAVNPKPPYIEAPKKSNAYRFYALDYNDPRVNFVLNTGDVACPQSVPILRPNDVEIQLNAAAAVFLKNQLVIDTKRRLIIVPKVCEVYKSDFGGDSLSCLKFCMGGLEEGIASTIRVMMMDESNLVIKYQRTADQYYTCLKLGESTSGQVL